LLYYPIYDRFSTPGNEMLEHFDGVGAQFDSTAFKEAAELMQTRGYTFDYISDKQIRALEVVDGKLVSANHSSYKTIVVPHCRFIPVATLRALLKLADEGAHVVMFKGLPESFSGYGNRESNQVEFNNLLSGLGFTTEDEGDVESFELGAGMLHRGDDLERLLTESGVRREELAEKGLTFIRKQNDMGALYFITNW